MRFILKFSTILLTLFLILIFYSSLIGFETKRFNNQILKNINKINKDLIIELQKIKIVLDPFNLKLNIRTLAPKLKNKDGVVELEYIKTQIPLRLIFSKNFLIKDLEISTKALEIQELLSFYKGISYKPEIFFFERIIKKGYVIADIKLEFNKDGKIRNNYKVKGILRDTALNVSKKYNLNRLNLLFDFRQNNLSLSQINFVLNDLKFFSESINLISLNNDLTVKGSLENNNINLKKQNIDLFLKPYLKNLNIDKILFKSKNEFSFILNKKFEFNDLIFNSEILFDELVIKNTQDLKFLFPNVKDNINFLNHKININYSKKKIKIQGNGKLLIQNEVDYLDYSIIKNNNKLEFKTLYKVLKNPLIINFLNYKKKEKNELTIKLEGNISSDNLIRFDTISLNEKENQIIITDLVLDKNKNINDLKAVRANFLDREGKKNSFNINKKKNVYYLNGSIFNANNFIDNLINNTNDKTYFKNENLKLDIDIEKVILDKNHILSNFNGNLFFKNQKIIKGNLIGFFSKDKKIEFTARSKDGQVIKTLFLDKAKVIVSRYKFIKGFERGILDFYSTKKNDQTISTLKIYDFKLKELPALTKLLTLASLQGIADILSGEGIGFEEFEMKFRNNGNLMTIDEIYAIGPAISILMSGYVEKNELISLRGTLVPATTINNAIGSIPVLGKILVGSKTGEGVFGVSFKIKGPPKKLETTVNPIKTLTPRFITRTLEKIKKN